MEHKKWQRLIDGMPPRVAEKVDKMIGDMKQLHDAATQWDNTNGDNWKSFVAGAKWMKEQLQPRLMNGDGSEIRKVQTKHVELLDEVNLEEISEEQIGQERNPNYKHFNNK